MCTETCTSPGLRAGPTDLESLLSGSGPGQPARELCSLVLASVGRLVNRQVETWERSTERSTDNPNGHKYDVGRLTGRSIDRPIWPQRLVFDSLYKLGFWASFGQDYWESFLELFSYLSQKFFNKFLEFFFSKSKGVFQE